MSIVGLSKAIASGSSTLIAMLAEAVDVRWQQLALETTHGVGAWILQDSDLSNETLRRSDVNWYCTFGVRKPPPEGAEVSTIEFGTHPIIPAGFRGRKIGLDCPVAVTPLPARYRKGRVLASSNRQPIWVMAEVGKAAHHCVALPVPELGENESAFQKLSGTQLLNCVPLVAFLRNLTDYDEWQPPVLHAAFMFDDPNLHWKTYGYMDFAEIAEEARLHGYHVSVATVPLDAWYVHRPTVAVFQQYRDQLSLVVHGSTHVAKELARGSAVEETDTLLRDALVRIAKLEQRSGLRVARIMIPPHGACSERTLTRMAQLSFEAACVSSGSLRWYNREATWVRTMGMRPCDVVGGLCVFHRFRLSRACEMDVLSAALFHQPIIPVGHHYDLAGGPDLLREVASLIDSVGPVKWASMEKMARSYYSQKIDGSILRVRPHTKRVRIPVPCSVDQLSIEKLGFVPDNSLLWWRGNREPWKWRFHEPGETIRGIRGQIVDVLFSEVPHAMSTAVHTTRRLCLWPLVRRNLAEARDRLSPLVARVLGSKKVNT